jgi:ADP-ribose pyrophosphatase
MLNERKFSRGDVEVLNRDELYRRFFCVEKIVLRHQLFKGGWSENITRELLLRGEAVAIVLYDPKNDLIGVVEQFRIGALEEPEGPWCYEVVAGILKSGELPREVAERELLEEANIVPYELIYICNFLSSPGGSDEKLHLFCGLCDLSQAGGIYGLPDEGEDIRFHVLSADEVFSQLLKGRFNNAAALICLQWLQLNRSSLGATQRL